MSATTTATDSAVAALRAKFTRTDPRDDITAIALLHRTRKVATWATKQEAEEALRALQARGLNVDKGIRVLRGCCTIPLRCWVITRLGEFGETLLMAKDGSWVAGRLFPERPGDHGAIWLPYESAEQGETIPATFTHVTRTVHDTFRIERYRTKSNGSRGRYVRGDDSVALCTCGWTAHEDTRPEAQAAARAHRAEVAA
jgi:hypothetical protein